MDDDTAEKIRKRQLEKIERANERLFVRECEEEGVDPSLGASPELLRWIDEQKGKVRFDA